MIDDKKAVFSIKSLDYSISDRDKEKMSNFSFSLFLSDIKFTTIYKDEADTTPSSSLFAKNSYGKWEDDGAVSSSSL